MCKNKKQQRLNFNYQVRICFETVFKNEKQHAKQKRKHTRHVYAFFLKIEALNIWLCMLSYFVEAQNFKTYFRVVVIFS